SLRIVEIAGQIAHPLGEPLPCGLREFVEMELAIMSGESFHCIGEVRTPLLRAHLGQVDANETKFLGQLVIVCQVVECRHDETLSQVAGCTENHHRAGGSRRWALMSDRSAVVRPSYVLHLSISRARSMIRSGSKPN